VKQILIVYARGVFVHDRLKNSLTALYLRVICTICVILSG